jgi:peptidoglycan/LPS O-acetylase OafA/YrhL
MIGEKNERRNISLDIARTIGTLLIVLAHVGAPKLVNNIRSFDVVLLVFVSGYCIKRSEFGLYLWKRIKRLVFPAWVLLILLFGATWFACFVLGKNQIYNLEKVIKSFLFLNGGIGFIWIVRIYLGIAVISPIIIFICNTVNNNIRIIIGSMLFVFIISFTSNRFVSKDDTLLYYLLEILSYGIVAMLGYQFKQQTEFNEDNGHRFIRIFILACFLLFLVTLFAYGFDPNEYKYPPQAQYIFYGLLITGLIFLLLNRITVNGVGNFQKCITHFSVLSYDIYLSHIFVLSIINMLEGLVEIELLWAIKYIIVLSASIAAAKLLVIIRKAIYSKREMK